MIKPSDIIAAQKRLDECKLSIITQEEMDQWNQEKNASMMFERDIALSGWEEDDGLLVKEFYIHDPSGINFGVYRKAWFNYEDDEPKDFCITDADHNEIALPVAKTPTRK